MEDTARKPLKRLSIVHRYADIAAGYGAVGQKFYGSVRTKVPAFAESSVAQIEDLAKAYAGPAVTYAADSADKLLHYADDKVDAAAVTVDNLVKTTHSTVNASIAKVYAVHDANMKTAQAAFDKYFELVRSTGEYVADKLSPQKNVQFAKDVLNSSLEKAKQATDPDVAVKMAADAWATFAAVPAVAAVLKTAEPATNVALKTFYSLHDWLVASPYYKRAVEVGGGVAGYAATTTPYKLSAHYVYPLVAPVADPALDKLSHSEVVASTIGYWKPLL